MTEDLARRAFLAGRYHTGGFLTDPVQGGGTLVERHFRPGWKRRFCRLDRASHIIGCAIRNSRVK